MEYDIRKTGSLQERHYASPKCLNLPKAWVSTMWAILGESPGYVPLSMATDADAHGVPQKNVKKTPGLVNGGAEPRFNTIVPAIPVLGSNISPWEKEYTNHECEVFHSPSLSCFLPLGMTPERIV